MQLKQLLDDDRAVSPVIGVILMVAITVILAAVIGTFVLGLGSGLRSSTPQTQLELSMSTVDVAGESRTAVEITHEAGDSLKASNLKVTVDGDAAYTKGSTANDVGGTFSGTVSAGTSITVVAETHHPVDPAGDDVYVDGGSGTALDIDTTPGAAGGLVVNVELTSGDVILVVWSSSEGDNSAMLGKFTIP